jgi:hypothetical protein
MTRRHPARPGPRKGRRTAHAAIEYRCQSLPPGNVDRILGPAGHVFQHAEEQHPDAHAFILTDWSRGFRVSTD